MRRQNRSGQDEPQGKLAVGLPGAISMFDVYCVDEAKLRLRWSDAAYRAAVRRGLLTLNSGKRRYLTGEEIIRFLKADSLRGTTS